MPIVTIASLRRASATAFLTTFRNSFGFATIWSLEKKPTTGSSSPSAWRRGFLPRCAARPTPSATAAPVSRRIGSPMILPFGTSGSSFRVAATRLFVVTTNASSGATSPSRRASAWRMRLSPPNTRRNCFGRSGVESGQNRSPEPPARMTALKVPDIRPSLILSPLLSDKIFRLAFIQLAPPKKGPRISAVS